MDELNSLITSCNAADRKGCILESSLVVALVARGALNNFKIDDHNDDDNEDNSDYMEVSKTVRKEPEQKQNLPQIPRQIHFFFLVFLAVLTAIPISWFPLSK